METEIDISIVIPFRNEAESLKILLPNLKNCISKISKKCEVLLIDDQSSDDSVKIVEEQKKTFPELKLLRMLEHGGQTGCYKLAFEQAKGKYIIRMDADLQDDPNDLPKFVEKIDAGAELVIGLREARKHPRLIRLASGLYDLLIVLLFNFPLHSNTGSYVLFKADLVKNIPWKKNDHRYLPLIAIRRGAKNIGEVFVKHGIRKYGESKYKPFKKIIFGIPEVILFLIRYLRGYYDNK